MTISLGSEQLIIVMNKDVMNSRPILRVGYLLAANIRLVGKYSARMEIPWRWKKVSPPSGIKPRTPRLVASSVNHLSRPEYIKI